MSSNQNGFSSVASMKRAAPAGSNLVIVLVVVFVALLLTLHLGRLLTDRPDNGDGRQNVDIAFSIAQRGSFSLSRDGSPTMYREPFPILALALQMKIDPRFADVKSASELDFPPAVSAIKQHNLIWAFLIYITIFLQLRIFFNDGVKVAISTAICYMIVTIAFLQNSRIIDGSVTEIQAAFLVLASGAASVIALRNEKYGYFVLVGIFLGLLSLTKSSFLYVALVYLASMPVALLISSRGTGALKKLGASLCMALGMVLVVMPWSLRNYVEFGTANIAERGGTVLWARALKNEMNDVEWRGAFYYYAPAPLSRVLGRVLGFSPADLEIDGPLRRLNRETRSSFAASDAAAEAAGRPEDAITFYRAARAERTRLVRDFAQKGASDPSVAADRELQKRAMARILSNPYSHLRATPVFLWRGIWAVRSNVLPRSIDTLLSVSGMGALFGLASWGFFGRPKHLFGMFGLPVGLIAFYALASHFIPRYAVCVVPSMVIALCIIGVLSFDWMRSRWGAASASTTNSPGADVAGTEDVSTASAPTVRR